MEGQKDGDIGGSDSQGLPDGANEMIDSHLVTYVVQVAPSTDSSQAPAPAEIRPRPLPQPPSR